MAGQPCLFQCTAAGVSNPGTLTISGNLRPMPRRFGLQLIVLLGLALLASGTERFAGAQEFRLESQMYVTGQDRPVADNLTLFSDHLIHDFSFAPDGSQTLIEIAIYDASRRRFVLVDVAREVRVEVEKFSAVQMLEQLRATLGEDPAEAWLVRPGFRETIDLDAKRIALDGTRVHYDAKCDTCTDAAVQARLYEFLDQFTLLGATDPRRFPPFARMQFNQALKKNGLIPVEVQLKIDSNELSERGLQAHSRHNLVYQLSSADRERIEQARKLVLSSKPVDLATYRNLPAVADVRGDSASDESEIKR